MIVPASKATRHARPAFRRAVLALVVAGVLQAGCGDDGPSDEPTLEATVAPDDTSGTAVGGDGDETSIGALRLTEVGAVPRPTAIAVEPVTGELYVASQDGQVHHLDAETGESSVVLDVPGGVSDDSEQGLLGITFDPDASHLYVSYTDPAGDSRVDEYEWADGEVVPDSQREVLFQEQPFPNHNGGDLHFGPDGFLYVGLGDGGAGGDPRKTGQDPSDLLGSILRLDPQPSGSEPYTVPVDNPFVDEGGHPLVWLYGVRNPWRFSFDRDTGDLWIGDVGQNMIEEIDFLPAVDGVDAGRGANLGWANMEGTRVFDQGEPDDHVPPIHDYGRDGGNCSVTGGYVYRGSAIAGLDGAYLYGDYCVGDLRYLRVDEDGRLVADEPVGLSVGAYNLSAFGEDLDGELYVLANGDGAVYRLEPA